MADRSNFPENVIQAWSLSCEVREKAYAPYSKYRVGAAVKARQKDDLVVGCNVENACFPAGICAEGNAIQSMVAQLGPNFVIDFIVVTTSNPDPAAPCGICRQTLSEFSDKKTQIYLANLTGIQKRCSMDELLPLSYSKEELRSGQD